MDRESNSGEPRAAGRWVRLRSWWLAEARAVPGERPLRTTLRTAHVLAFSALYGGHVYGLTAERLVVALVATAATGGALLCLEIYRTPSWLIQIRGLATLVKLGLVASLALCWDCRIALLTLVVVIGVVASHMPGRYRYYSPLHGRSIDQGGKG